MIVTFDVPQDTDLITFTLIGSTNTSAIKVRSGSLSVSEGKRHAIFTPDGKAYQFTDREYLEFRKEFDEWKKKK